MCISVFMAQVSAMLMDYFPRSDQNLLVSYCHESKGAQKRSLLIMRQIEIFCIVTHQCCTIKTAHCEHTAYRLGRTKKISQILGEARSRLRAA